MLRKLFINPSYNYLRIHSIQTLRTVQQAATTDKTQSDDFSLQPSQIDEAIKCQPQLANALPEHWQRTHEIFATHGIQTNNFLRIACNNPAILSRAPQKILQSIDLWRSCQFGEHFLHLLLIKYPEFLDLTERHQLMPVIGFLRSYVGTTKNVWKLLMNSPDLLSQSEQRIEQKFDYLSKRMRIEIPEIVKSEAMSKELSDIQCRHVFLERLGMFKPRPLKADPNDPTTNPRLYQISNTSDKTFATKVCHVKQEEFEAFQDLFKKEQERNNEDDDEDDDDEGGEVGIYMKHEQYRRRYKQKT